MKSVKTLCHSDTIRGMTLLDDGRWCLWGEGFGDIDIITPATEDAPPTHTKISNNSTDPIVDALQEMGEMRAMTDAEEAMFEAVRSL